MNRNAALWEIGWRELKTRLTRALTKHHGAVKHKSDKADFVTINTTALSCSYKSTSHCYRKCSQAVRQQKRAFMSLVITTGCPLLIAI